MAKKKIAKKTKKPKVCTISIRLTADQLKRLEVAEDLLRTMNRMPTLTRTDALMSLIERGFESVQEEAAARKKLA